MESDIDDDNSCDEIILDSEDDSYDSPSQSCSDASSELPEPATTSQDSTNSPIPGTSSSCQDATTTHRKRALHISTRSDHGTLTSKANSREQARFEATSLAKKSKKAKTISPSTVTPHPGTLSSCQDVTTSHQDVITSNQDETTSYKDLATSNQYVANSRQDVTNAHQDLTNAHQDVTNAHQDVTNAHQDVTNANKDVTNAHQDVTTSSMQQAASSSLVTVGYGPSSLRTVGGSVSTCTKGDKLFELVGAVMQEAEMSDYGCTVERREERSNKQVHVHLTKTDIHQPKAVSIGGGEIRVGPAQIQRRTPDPGQLSHLKRLRTETEKSFNEWTEGMVMTEAARTIINKVNQGRAWVTVTGCPGEGKTTAGYLALKDLHKRGREVFDVRTPDDYFRAREVGQSVIMLNDIFGDLTFDSDSFKKWQGVLSDVLALSEHKLEVIDIINKNRKQNKPEVTVILISRSSILREASSSMGKFKHLVLKDDNTVDLTDMIELKVTERIDIWKYHAEKYGINIDRRIVKEVCSMELSYGFPHCCRLFAAMYTKNNLLDMKHFFLKPLEFLNQSMESLIEDSITGPLLREMLKNNGSLDLDDVEDHEKRYQYTSSAKTMIGTFIALHDRKLEFHHPSIYDSAAFLICQMDPRFVISFCSLSFLNERVRLKELTQHGVSESHQTLSIGNNFEKVLLERFWKDFQTFNISGVLSNASFVDEGFVSKFMQNLLTLNRQSPSSEDINDVLNVHDKQSNKSFLYLMTKSGSDKILRYIHQYVELTKEQQSEALFGACEHSSVSALEYLFQRYKDIDLEVTNRDNQTPLLVTTKQSSQDMIRILLTKNVNVNALDNQEKNPLLNVCNHGVDGDGSVVKMLIDKGAIVTIQSPLCLACKAGHTNVVKALLNQGVDINKTDDKGWTPLQFACFHGHVDVVTVLLDRGADINKTNDKGWTPLQFACFHGHVDVVTVLLDKGADVNKIHDNGWTPLHLACFNGHVDVVTVLLDRGADINKTTDIGSTPLHLASRNGHVDVVTVLLDRGADINKTIDDCWTPLHLACQNGHVDVVTVLLDRGADINKTTDIGSTPLHLACIHGHVNVVTVLLDKGADVNKTTDKGWTPLNLACQNGHVDVVTVLLDRGADINKTEDKGWTPLHIACQNGHVDVVTVLLDRGADVNKTNDKGSTPLNLACQNGHVDVVTVLLDRGADVNKTIDKGWTPLNLACQNGHVDVVTVLLDRGADVNKTIDKGWTPLHIACFHGHVDVVTVLLGRGADVNIRNTSDQTPLAVAIRKQRTDVQKLLLERQ